MHFYYESSKNENAWIKLGDIYQATEEITVTLRDDTGMHYKWTLLPGFRTDGGSVPLAFRWFVPSWSDTVPLVNLAYALHDAAYGSGLMHRDIADDMLRGLLRDAGFSRFRASTVCWAVNNFAAGHYGVENDKYDCRLFASLRVYK